MKITYILPGIGKKSNEKYLKTWEMEPLTIAALKALTPKDIDTEFFDDRIELINFDTKTDLVLISVETYTAKRSYEIAKRFRNRDIKVIMGGYHVTLLHGEALEYCDSVIIGNAELVFGEMLNDFLNNSLKDRYIGSIKYNTTLPDKSIYSDKKYLPISLIETGRGCIFNCEFCAIASYYNSHYHPRPIEDIISDIKRSGKKFIFFVDDNIVANQQYAIELFKAITPLKIKWSGQGSLTMAKNDELLKWMRKSGCDVILIGFESLEEENLNQMNKEWSARLGERDELVNKIHNAGISIYATFVFGFDFDTKGTFKKALEFSNKHNFYFVAFNHLLPFPGTPLYERLLKENRLTSEKWWLKENYKYGDIPYLPKNMTPQELTNLCANARRTFYNIPSIVKRGLTLLKRNRSLLISFIFWTQNFTFKKEVDRRLNIPVGRGLDELPK